MLRGKRVLIHGGKELPSDLRLCHTQTNITKMCFAYCERFQLIGKERKPRGHRHIHSLQYWVHQSFYYKHKHERKHNKRLTVWPQEFATNVGVKSCFTLFDCRPYNNYCHCPSHTYHYQHHLRPRHQHHCFFPARSLYLFAQRPSPDRQRRKNWDLLRESMQKWVPRMVFTSLLIFTWLLFCWGYLCCLKRSAGASNCDLSLLPCLPMTWPHVFLTLSTCSSLIWEFLQPPTHHQKSQFHTKSPNHNHHHQNHHHHLYQ